MSDAVLVQNAADPEQVQAGRRRESQNARDRRTLVATQLSTPDGRRFVWEEIARHGVFDKLDGSLEAVYAANAAANAGRTLLEEVMQQHPQGYLTMQAEALRRQQQARDEIEARKNQRRPQTDD